MSKEQQQYQQTQLKLRKRLVQDMLKGTNYPNNEFYPFPVPPQNYFYNYMFPYPPSPFFPLCPPPFMPLIDTRNKSDNSYTRIEDREEQSIKHQKIKSESAQQKDYLIKVQEFIPKKKQISEQMEPIKPPQKKIKKQLYKVQMNPSSPTKNDQEFSELEIKFKRLIQDHVHGVIQQKLDISLYEHQFSDLISENKHFFEEMMKALLKRFRQYKKTKQELIKLIIRRTYHALKHHKNILCQKPEYERLQAFHYKNLTTFKSMNVHFLRRQFSNPLFVQLFKEFLANFQAQFQRENGQKIQRYATILVTCWYQKSTKLLLSQRKLPWANSYKQRIKKISLELLKEHEGVSTSNDSEPKK